MRPAHRRIVVLACLASVFLSAPLLACLWDSDTLAAEAKGLPEVVRILTGRFERNPPLYYEMRLKRVAAAIESTPSNLGLYDDAGVACDRLGRDDEASAWMGKKWAQIEVMGGPKHAPLRDHVYRYYANLGTFRVHRWAKAGADRSKLDDVKAARDDIAKAIEINPDAHFGREFYQLRAIEWILNPPDYDPKKPLPTILTDVDLQRSEAAIKGLTGLIALGNAWESVDILNSLIKALDSHGDTALAFWVRFRATELIEGGRRSLLPTAPTDAAALIDSLEQTMFDIPPQEKPGLRATFAEARSEAEAWHKARTAYMMSRLEAGRHPDTDPTFWADYKETAPPELPGGSIAEESAATYSVRLMQPATVAENRRYAWILAAFLTSFLIIRVLGRWILTRTSAKKWQHAESWARWFGFLPEGSPHHSRGI